MSPSASTDPTDSKPPLRLMLCDSPRTTCQVFYKLWQSHPQIAWGRFYHGFNGYQCYGPDRISLKLRHSKEAEHDMEELWVKPYEQDPDVQKLYPPDLESAKRKFVDCIESSERDGKVFFGKEHILFLIKQDLMLETLRREDRATNFPPHADNPTYIPDEVLRTLTPLFMIRHPQLMIDSHWHANQKLLRLRPEDEDFEMNTTLKWTRILYDYFNDQLGIKPVIIDSEDFIFHTKAVTDKLCELYGLDSEGVSETWDPVPEEYWPKSAVAKQYIGHMLASKGVERPEKRPSTDLDEQTTKWAEKYGDDVAAGLRKRVEGEMPVYAYLLERKLDWS